MVQIGRQEKKEIQENLLFEEEIPQGIKLGEEDEVIKDQIDTEELRRIKVPAHRMNPLKSSWE